MTRISAKEIAVVHFTTSTIGGAGIAAMRLNKALNSAGIDSQAVTLRNTSNEEIIDLTYVRRNPLEMILSKIMTFCNSRLSQKSFFSVFSRGLGGVNSLLKSLDPKKTILHVHNWYNLIDFKQLLKLEKLGFRIVLTMHDERMLTRGCHASFGCIQVSRSCKNCPLIIRPLNWMPELLGKIEGLEQLLKSKNVVTTTPSLWMKEKTKESVVMQNADVRFIPNQFLAAELTLAPVSGAQKSHLVVGMASISKNSYLKGSDILQGTISALNFLNTKIEFIHMADFGDSDKSSFWSEIDFLLVLSRSDNSPNVIHEARYFGVPIIGTDVGGIPELLDDRFDHCLVLNEEIISNLTKLLLHLTNSKLTIETRKVIRELTHSDNYYLEQYVNLYLELMQSS